MAKLERNSSQVRIIAGRWRGRKIPFATQHTIRPTPDRVRETLFNWLSPYLANSRCLDLYAGSGVLGFEALSRGASEMVFVDSIPAIISNLKSLHSVLKIDSTIGENKVQYLCRDAIKYLTSQDKKFDLIFLDPPYYQNIIQAVIHQLETNSVVNNNGLIYIEMAKDEILPTIPANWKIIKKKIMAQVACYLLHITQ